MEMMAMLIHTNVINELGDVKGKMLGSGQLRATPITALCYRSSQRQLFIDLQKQRILYSSVSQPF